MNCRAKTLLLIAALALMTVSASTWTAPMNLLTASLLAAEGQTATASGKITAVSDTSFALEVKKESESAGQTQTMNFVIDKNTKIEGNLEVGAQATVEYRIENGQNVATSVRAQKS